MTKHWRTQHVPIAKLGEKPTMVFILVILILSGCQPEPVNGSTGIGDAYYPELGNGGYDVQKYTLILDVDPVANALNANEIIDAIAIERLASFNLDFQGLTVDDLSVNDSAATIQRRGHELMITPSRPLTSGKPFTIEIKYHGNPEPGEPVTSPAFIGKVGWFHNSDGSITVQNEPNGAANWFPVNDHPHDKATYRFDIRVPQPWVAVAPGTLRETTNDDDHTRYIWDMDKPMVSYLAAINIDKFVLETAQGPNEIRLRSYFKPGLPDPIKSRSALLPAMIEYFASLFGPYPFEEYGVLVVGDAFCQSNTIGEEVQTMSVFCPDQFIEPLIAHELAHQWIGDSVSLNKWQDLWLKEGLATYAQMLWVTRDGGLDELNAKVKPDLYRHYLMPTGKPDVADLYSTEVYEGGALVFHALRLKVGDEAFFKILQTYLEQYRDSNAGPDEFITVAEKVSRHDLKALFDEWLYKAEAPDIPELTK
jgi:aminopeptidase N